MSYESITQNGTTVALSTGWDTDDDSVVSGSNYSLSVPSLQSEYTIGDKLFLDISYVRKFTSTNLVCKNLEYKLELIDADKVISFIDWDDVSYTQTENFIYLDTSWLHTGYKYALTFRHKSDGSTLRQETTKTFKLIDPDREVNR